MNPVVVQQKGVSPNPTDVMQELTNLMHDLKVNLANAAQQKGQPVNERANVWCTNCKGRGHLNIDCPSPQGISPKCRHCGGDHDSDMCNQTAESGRQRNQRNQSVYQVGNDFNSNSNGWRGNNNNWNNSNGGGWNRRPRYPRFNDNPNGNNFAPPGNLSPSFNANNFNAGGYNSNPNRFIPRNPTTQNMGWNQMPYGNPNQGNPTYGGRNPSWDNIVCFNCNQ